MESVTIEVNGEKRTVAVGNDTPLLWALREELRLLGPKFGCGKGLCGACTVLMNGAAIRSCSVPAVAAKDQKITTIEGIAQGDTLHPLQQAWIDHNVPQCGYCQSGQIMGALSLLQQTPQPSDADIDTAMAGHICRCGTYPRIRAAIKSVAKQTPTPQK